MRHHYLKVFTVILLIVGIIGCDSQARLPTVLVGQKLHASTWDRMTDSFRIKTYHYNPRVQYFVRQYSANNGAKLIKNSQNAAPYIYHIVRMLEERGLPSELALLPIVESEYRPHATSNRGAAGIWQLAAATGRIYGLKQDSWYDGRKDIEAATAAALGHLLFLYEKFDNDWLLALAAYNAGHGRVEKAIRINKKLGKPTDYWSLSLPKETQYFVPKFLAIAYLIKNARAFGFDLAQVPNKPYFTQVNLSSQIDLNMAAKMAEMDVAEIKKLNAGCRSHVTHPAGPHKILLPIKHASIFKANLIVKNKAKPKPKATTTTQAKVIPAANTMDQAVHTVTTGDTLHIIAAKYRTTVKSIKHKNQLKSDIIVHGQKLAI